MNWTRINETRHTATGARGDRYCIDRERIGAPWTASHYSKPLCYSNGRTCRFVSLGEAKAQCEMEDRQR